MLCYWGHNSGSCDGGPYIPQEFKVCVQAGTWAGWRRGRRGPDPWRIPPDGPLFTTKWQLHYREQADCIESVLPNRWHTFIWWKNQPKWCATRIPHPFGRHQNPLPNIKCRVLHFLEGGSLKKMAVLRTHNPSAEEVWKLEVFLCKADQNFENRLKIQTYTKELKHI